mmetsp:Transcript_13774/g.28440  ORF Transcript_13774/g.28440 Transcript_13774/m.28440 type:complete len:122 (-) Transcript_13774:43-408(-)
MNHKTGVLFRPAEVTNLGRKKGNGTKPNATKMHTYMCIMNTSANQESNHKYIYISIWLLSHRLSTTTKHINTHTTTHDLKSISEYQTEVSTNVFLPFKNIFRNCQTIAVVIVKSLQGSERK